MNIRNLCFLVLIVLISGNFAIADQITIRPDAPERYVVVKGDTLWDISERFLNDPWLWPEVWQLNPEIANPHLIYPGDIIYLTYDQNGRPKLTVERGRPTMKLSPSARSSRIDKAIPTIPVDAIHQFLTRGGILTKEEYEKAPYVVAFQDDRIIAATADTAYVRGLPQDSKNNLYSIVRLGKAYRDPSGDKEILGYETIEVGSAELAVLGDPSTLNITDSNREVLAGDRVFPASDDDALENYFPHSPNKHIEGIIIAVLDGVSRIGQFHVVAINKGASAGIEKGHVFTVFQSGRQVRDPYSNTKPGQEVTLPDIEAGHILVFRTFENLSYGLVMRALKDIRIHDKIQTPK
jgi:hypothetical protein